MAEVPVRLLFLACAIATAAGLGVHSDGLDLAGAERLPFDDHSHPVRRTSLRNT